MPDTLPILCYVTDRHSLRAAPGENPVEVLLEKIEAAAAAGVDWIQLREKDLSGKECAALVREVLRRVGQTVYIDNRSRGISAPPIPVTRILINDRLDVAMAERAGGVHLGENSLPVKEVKRMIDAVMPRSNAKNGFLAGVSCHSLEAAQSAVAAGADYLFFGPVFATPSKAAFGAPQGLDLLAKVCRAVTIPVLAIGGITLENAAACFAAGATGIAAIRLFHDAADLRQLAARLRQLKS
jgi:thiamine-phosphate pyrophosphorylase